MLLATVMQIGLLHQKETAVTQAITAHGRELAHSLRSAACGKLATRHDVYILYHIILACCQVQELPYCCS